MDLDENILQTKTVGTIVEIMQDAMEDMHPYSHGFRKFEEIIDKRNKALNLLGSYAVNKGAVRSLKNE